MKKKYFILLSIIFITLPLLQLSTVAEAVNYDTEIGLTFNSDVSVSGDSSSSTTVPSGTDKTSESSQTKTSTSTSGTSNKMKELPETNRKKNAKSGLLPSTGTKSNTLVIKLGILLLMTVFVLLIFKLYKVVTKKYR
ncbi:MULTISPECIES: LPXTG cell wall anchor domain-containing protein [Enterococcus]|uniref:LPXTG-domain-containing protein cell wall anchor domain n=2 Tax=Enterococcus TaxID=1350 RepID=R3WRQ4_9ENTE|nr:MULTISPECIES: LPXTG cell wall anchor domain-containing protein [Enterococcus]EOL44485.1 LPXTG-domain-containing protein cell wall anchor domain [Enterococcus caccae ATCC BAA-1240]EOT68399.1 hypothetical protein I580_00782 [Enterococcus caccae ATCC BAA-1240]MBO0441962.1 LPXTG cell wall anchor domain-containing protein [Enterococcus sp. DIV0869a]OJG22018.1 LPXTG-domain-containing protein cell wall anchor domain [Enterococcus caccae]